MLTSYSSGSRTPGARNKIYGGPKCDFECEFCVFLDVLFQKNRDLRKFASAITQKNVIQTNYSS